MDGIMGTGSYGEIVPALAEMMAGGTSPPLCRHPRPDRRVRPGADHAGPLCLPAHRRGLRQPLRLLRDPVPAGTIPQPPHGGRAGGGKAAGRRRCEGAASSSPRTSPATASTCTASRSWRRCCGSCASWTSTGSGCTISIPTRFTDELIDTIAAEEPRCCNYLDIPIQHCNDKVLRADEPPGRQGGAAGAVS